MAPGTPRETALRAAHERAGARLVEFAGWTMPVQYAAILEEVRTVRTAAGLFDLGHMARLAVTGPGAVRLVDSLVTNDVGAMKEGEARYALLCREDGGVLDDLLVYRETDGVFVVANAANREKVLASLRRHASPAGASVEDLSDRLAMLALQGPKAERILEPLTDLALPSLRYYRIARGSLLGLSSVRIARTGYTGEDGFEFFLPGAEAERAWTRLLEAGSADGLRPIGLGARDTLRLEAGMPLYGHEIDETTNPIEAGLSFAVKFTPGRAFLGREALEKVAAAGPRRRLVGFRAETKRIPRQGYPILDGESRVGVVCSGTYSPTLEATIGTGYVPRERAEAGTRLAFEVRGERHALEVVAMPFYKRKKG